MVVGALGGGAKSRPQGCRFASRSGRREREITSLEAMGKGPEPHYGRAKPASAQRGTSPSIMAPRAGLECAGGASVTCNLVVNLPEADSADCVRTPSYQGTGGPVLTSVLARAAWLGTGWRTPPSGLGPMGDRAQWQTRVPCCDARSVAVDRRSDRRSGGSWTGFGERTPSRALRSLKWLAPRAGLEPAT